MLKKIISIKNVGRFLNGSSVGDVQFKRFNLVFAENGRGKTTLCAILRSLQSGDAAHLLGRTTLGTDGPPRVDMLLDEGPASFKNGSWSATLPNLAIFDSLFVSENVHAGDVVSLDHKRNLHGVIVGKHGAELARRIEDLDSAIREKSADIREEGATVQALTPGGLSVEGFLSLQASAEVDTRITECEGELAAVAQADQIRRHGTLSELSLPVFPAVFQELLRRTVDGIAEDAERDVAAQIDTHAMGARGEAWLSEGTGYIRGGGCPFCGQSLHGVELLAAYKAYFGRAYNALRTEIAALRRLIEVDFGDREIAGIERTLQQNAATVEFWSRYCAITPPAFAGDDELGDQMRALREAALALVDQKAASLLSCVDPGESFVEALGTLAGAQGKAEAHNRAAQIANAIIEAKKTATRSADAGVLSRSLAHLRATKRRHEPDVASRCEGYLNAQASKRILEAQKTEIKSELDEYTKDVAGRFEQTLNRLLDDFQTGFQITSTRHGYPGGVASSSYQILINDTPVDLGDPSTPTDRPSFRNTLSSGDKSTLALAFFLAQLEHDPEKAGRVVVLDDPFGSQDGFRMDCTVQKIKECGETCRQVIVLSHNRLFLKRAWERLAAHSPDRKCLQLERMGLRDTRVAEWDIEDATQSRFDADRSALADYHNFGEGTPGDIVTKIRPVLETHCRNLSPGEFVDQPLGAIIGEIRTAGAPHPLFSLLSQLDALNAYTCRYHHGENPCAVSDPIDGSELQGFVAKCLQIIGGC